MYRKVNLYIIGAMKSGTTSLHDYLNRHKDIYMSEEKEPFFHSSLRWCNYSEIYTKAAEEKCYGESSTIYSKLPTYPEVVDNIKSYNPDAYFIYIDRQS